MNHTIKKKNDTIILFHWIHLSLHHFRLFLVNCSRSDTVFPQSMSCNLCRTLLLLLCTQVTRLFASKSASEFQSYCINEFDLMLFILFLDVG